LALLEDLEALPPGVKGEIIEGVLYTMTRPRARHQLVAIALGSRIHDSFGAGRSGPGGWWILVEPAIELANTPEMVPQTWGQSVSFLPVVSTSMSSVR
jgi:hypothetical protein